MKQVKVQCDDLLGERPLPRSFDWDNRSVEVIEIIDYWNSQEHRYYKVRSEDDCVYILRQEPNQILWEVTMFERREFSQDGSEQQVFHHNFRGKV